VEETGSTNRILEVHEFRIGSFHAPGTMFVNVSAQNSVLRKN